VQSREQIRAAYDAVAGEYAARFADELADKPLDRELLDRFVRVTVPGGTIYDLGCGPGQTTAFLASCGANVRGLDLSPALLVEARRRHPSLEFVEGDMLALPVEDGHAAGIVAFYSLVHFSDAERHGAFREMARALHGGGILLVAFHIGDDAVRIDEFLGKPVVLEFTFLQPARVVAELERAGFRDVDVVERDHYPDVEYPSRRAYVFARKRSSD
jgi:SAM-dependent methyltransferase